MRHFILLLSLPLLLAGCNRGEVIKVSGSAHFITCEGLPQTTGTEIEIIPDKNIIKYFGTGGESYVVGATKCMIH